MVYNNVVRYWNNTIYRNMVKLLSLERLPKISKRRIFCFTKNPYNGDTIQNTTVIVESSCSRIKIKTYTIQEEEETEIPKSARTRGRIWTRRSTTPL